MTAPATDAANEDSGSWWGFAGFGLLFLAFALLGRRSVVENESVSLVWPAAGIGFLWLLHQRGVVRHVACLVAMSSLLAAVMLWTGASATLAVAAVCAAAAQTALVVGLLRRWCRNLLGAGGEAGIHSLDVLGRGTAATLLATAVGAAIGGVGLAVDAGTPHVLDFATWWARNLTGILVVGSVGHLLWEWQRGDRGRRRLSHAAIPELTVLLVVSAAAYVAIFTQPGLPLTFLGIPLSVWAALRFPTLVAASHTAVFGSVAVVLTLNGRGPFGHIAGPEVEALVIEAFLLTSMLTALTISAARDERAALTAELGASERAAAERAELLDAMTEAMTEGLAVVDADGNLVRMNAACRALLELTPQGVVASTRSYEIQRTDGSRLPPSEFPSVRAFTEGIVPPVDVHMRFADGTVRILRVNAAALTGGSVHGARTSALVVYRDVTDDRQERSQLADFASTVAHDLRSPLTAVRGWLDLASVQLADAAEARGRATGDDVTDARTSIARAEAASLRMATLIQELLSQATAEGRQLELESIDLSGPGGLVHEIAELLPGDVDLFVADIPPVLADEDLVHQLMSNLLGNAVKYADPDRRLRLSVSGSRLHNRVQIEVTDNGVGVPEDQRARVFVRFHRAHAGDRRFAGTGLGLALCQTIVERHGGIIECLPAANGVGTTFRFDLPAADETFSTAGSEGALDVQVSNAQRLRT